METDSLESTTQFGFGKSDFFTKETSIAPRPNVTLESRTATQTPLPVCQNRHAQSTT